MYDSFEDLVLVYNNYLYSEKPGIVIDVGLFTDVAKRCYSMIQIIERDGPEIKYGFVSFNFKDRRKFKRYAEDQELAFEKIRLAAELPHNEVISLEEFCLALQVASYLSASMYNYITEEQLNENLVRRIESFVGF